MTRRPRVAFLAWTPAPGRARDIAHALGGEPRTFFALNIVRRPVIPARYLIDAVRTAAYLVASRPRALIATHPPLFPGMIGFAYARIARVPFVLDSHIGAFGLAGDALSRALLPLHARLARRADAVLVADDELAARVRAWGGRALLVHEPPVPWPPVPPRPAGERTRVLFPGTFRGDEPVAEVVEAAARLPAVDVVVTGDPRKRPIGLLDTLPSNVTLAGFLDPDSYRRVVQDADIVLSLSTERNSVMRTAHEAVYADRPLVVADRPLLRELFPHAVHAPVTATGIAAGIEEAIDRHAELIALAPQARALQEKRWNRQLGSLTEVLGLGRVAQAPTPREPVVRA